MALDRSRTSNRSRGPAKTVSCTSQTARGKGRSHSEVFCLLICWLCFMSVTASAQHTYYISKGSGSDSNTSTQAQSKSTPWAHLPGMHSCASNCASYTPVAGDRFILKGGDTWVAGDLGIDWEWSGTSASRIYIGVDQTWYAGSSWSRPVFNCQTSSCGTYSYAIIWLAKNYTTFDNIEITGYQQSAGTSIVATYGNYNEVEDLYIHGWSRTAGSGSVNSFALANNWSGGGGIGTTFHNNVIDGADDPNKDFMGGILHGDMVYNNVVRYVYNGMNGVFNDIHGNLVEYNYVSTSGDHCNMVFFQGLFTASAGYVYNNVIRHSGCPGGSTLWLLGNANCTNCAMYAYNNVIYDVSGDFDPVDIPIGNHPGNSGGPFYIYNNTLEAGGSDAIGNGESPPRFTTYYSNNHFINVNNTCLGTGTTCTNNGTNLIQTASQADSDTSPHYDQYTASETYAYSPVAATNSTVGMGTNYTSMCSGNLSTLCSDTSYATYDTTNHVVVMRTVDARPSSGAWDAGAYEFAGGGDAPAPPTSLIAMPQ